MLDSRAPPQQLQEQEEREEAEIEKEVKHLMGETRLWRLANSAQWVAWGIVQAKLPGLPDFDSETKKNTAVNGTIPEEKQDYMNPQSDQGVGVIDSPFPEANAVAEGLQDKKAEEGADLGDAGSSSGTAEEEEFDYLGYANDRAMFFWGDAVRLGIVKDDELPEELRQRLKLVDY